MSYISLYLHIFVFLCEDVVVKYGVVSSLLLKKVPIKVLVQLRRINSNKVASSLVFQHWLFYHWVVGSLLLCLGSDRERAPIFFAHWVWSTYAIQLLFKDFGEECLFNQAALCCSILLMIALVSGEAGAEANRSRALSSILLILVGWTTLRISILLLNLKLLLLLILDSNKIEQVGNQIPFNFEIQLSVRVQAWTQVDF